MEWNGKYGFPPDFFHWKFRASVGLATKSCGIRNMKFSGIPWHFAHSFAIQAG
jgi:hypothetical protein